MGKDNRYDFDSGSSDSLGGSGEENEAVNKTEETIGSGENDTEQPVSTSNPKTVEPVEDESNNDMNANSKPTTDVAGDGTLPNAGEAGSLRTGETNHTLPEQYSMANLPIKLRRSNVKQHRDVDLTIAIQDETLADVQDAKRKLEEHFGENVPKTDVYEIVMISGANDDLSLLDAAHIVGYGFD